MKRIAVWTMILALVTVIGGIKVQASEGEVRGIELEAAVTESPKGLQEMWQTVKDSAAKVRATKVTMEKAGKDLAEATKKKDVDTCHKALKDQQDRFKKEVDALCTAVDEFSQWIEPQEVEEPDIEEGMEVEIEESDEDTEVEPGEGEPGAELEWLDEK